MHIAETDVPIHENLTKRWSPYAMAGGPVDPAELAALFEAARWTPSSMNEQPWAFFVALQGTEAFERAVECLVEGNQPWARQVPVLVFAAYKKAFDRNGKPNVTAPYDLGAAAANLTFEATARGLYVHQMGGVLPEKIRETFEVPETHVPLTAIAIGRLGEGDEIPESVLARDDKRRGRRSTTEFVFGGPWGSPAPWTEN